MASFMEGTVHLLVSGAQRQAEEDRQRWLSLVSSLMNVKLNIVNGPAPDEKLTVIQTPNLGDHEKYLIISPFGPAQSLQLELTSISEQIISATAFLILNELGRYPADERQQHFESLTNVFPYTIARINSEQMNFDSEQIERLSRGETIIVWKTEFGRGLSINVFAPWGSSNDLLKLGTINFFDPYPNWLLTLGLLIALVFLAVWVMGIIRKLSYQLTQLQIQVDAIEPEYLVEELEQPKGDIVAQLKWKIDSMSKRIERLLSQKSYMIRAVSHDLRTPLSKAQFRLESLAAELGAKHPMLSATKQNLGQLNLMIDELLSYEKLSQTQDIKFETLDIATITQKLTQDIQVVYPHAEFICTSSSNLCIADINQTLFTRMLENLLNNAGRYCKSKVNVNVGIDNDRQFIELAVIDDGKGISEQARESIFDPFFQEEPSRNAKFAGYGLGLAIVKQILKQHNATIQLADNSSQGAHFIVKLPVKQGVKNEEQ